jgi:hypothetical protein
MTFAYLLIALLFFIVIFILFHLRSLSEDEINELGEKKRKKGIEKYYTYDPVQYIGNREAKKSMPPYGGFFPVDWSFNIAPSIIASLLKSKKHEWVVIAFEKDRSVQYLWMNKGPDKTSVGIGVSIDRVLEICQQSAYKSILVLHNHINSRPNLYNTGIPSNMDLETANEWAIKLNNSGISLVEYICERGIPHRYFLRVAETFLPLANYLIEIKQENGKSWSDNLSLHFERIF